MALLCVVAAAFVAVGVTAARVLRPGPGTAPAYDEKTWALVRRSAPGLAYERGLLDAPVDPRVCRATACAKNARPVLFTHVIRRGETVYIQYWEYYPDSSWHGIAGIHADDWESVQIRINPDGTTDARASAHHGYTGHRIGPDLNVNQIDPHYVPKRWRQAWTRWTGWLRVAKNSHAGFITTSPAEGRSDPAERVTLIPLETNSVELPQTYAITPPWRKTVYTDPESPAT